MRDPPQEVIRAALDYDPDTGIFRWRERVDRLRPWNRKHAGKIAGGLDSVGYIQIVLNRDVFRGQRLAWIYVNGSIPQGVHVDHKNRNRTDNSLDNLRLASHSQNMANGPVRSNNTSGFKGVVYRATGRKHYRAILSHQGKTISLGSYATPEEAHAAWVRAAAVTRSTAPIR